MFSVGLVRNNYWFYSFSTWVSYVIWLQFYKNMDNVELEASFIPEPYRWRWLWVIYDIPVRNIEISRDMHCYRRSKWRWAWRTGRGTINETDLCGKPWPYRCWLRIVLWDIYICRVGRNKIREVTSTMGTVVYFFFMNFGLIVHCLSIGGKVGGFKLPRYLFWLFSKYASEQSAMWNWARTMVVRLIFQVWRQMTRASIYEWEQVHRCIGPLCVWWCYQYNVTFERVW